MDNFFKKMLKFSAEKLGVYVAKDSISVVEVNGRKIVAYAQIPLAPVGGLTPVQPLATGAFSGGIQNIEAIEEALRSNKIKAKRVCLGMASQDQFIRSFQMLMLGASEINLGVQFEVKKYIPFRIEDLAFDYQYRANKKAGKMDVLFVATTKNNLDNYFASLNEVGLSVAAVEPSSLSLLRILSLTKQLNTTISFALVEARGQEAEFTVIDKGFPCFSHEIKLPSVSDTDEASYRTPLTSEIRVSMDYYRRQFAGAHIDKVFFLSKHLPHQEALISSLSADLGLPVERVELSRDQEANGVADLNMLKAYALALRDTVKTNVAINLTKKRLVKAIVEETPVAEAKVIAFNANTLKVTIPVALLLIGLAYGFPQIKLNEINAKLKQLQSEARSILPPYLKDSSVDTLKAEKEKYINNIAALDTLLKTRSMVTPLLNTLPREVPQGTWIENISIAEDNNRRTLRIKGAVYSEDVEAAPEIVNSFYRKLKNNPALGKLKVGSMSRAQRGEHTVTEFEIIGDLQ